MQILRLKSVALPTELPGLECQRDLFSVSFPSTYVYPAATGYASRKPIQHGLSSANPPDHIHAGTLETVSKKY